MVSTPQLKGGMLLAVLVSLTVLGPRLLRDGSAPSLSPLPSGDREIVVSASGRVARPGVFFLPPGSSVADLAERAQPLLPRDALEKGWERPLAGAQEIFFFPGARSSFWVLPLKGASRLLLFTPIDLNTAGVSDLEPLPHIGPELARRIVTFRREWGPFQSVDGLLDVRGVGVATLEAVRPFLSAEGSYLRQPTSVFSSED